MEALAGQGEEEQASICVWHCWIEGVLVVVALWEEEVLASSQQLGSCAVVGHGVEGSGERVVVGEVLKASLQECLWGVLVQWEQTQLWQVREGASSFVGRMRARDCLARMRPHQVSRLIVARWTWSLRAF